jgi:hypothetical protein
MSFRLKRRASSAQPPIGTELMNGTCNRGPIFLMLGKRPEVITRWAAHADRRKQTHEAFRRRYEELDEVVYSPNRRKRQRGRS